MKLTTSEMDALRALDWACWEDAEDGGGGWAFIPSVAHLLGVGYCWTSQLLNVLFVHDLAERRWRTLPSSSGRGVKKRTYAPSEVGADLLLAADSTPTQQHPSDQKRGS